MRHERVHPNRIQQTVVFGMRLATVFAEVSPHPVAHQDHDLVVASKLSHSATLYTLEPIGDDAIFRCSKN